MKALLLLTLLIVAGVFLYMSFAPVPVPAPTPTPAAQQGDAAWQAPIPEGTELLPDGQARLHVRPVRSNENGKVLLEFHITEENGYMVDGIRVQFWPRLTNEATGERVDSPQRVDYFIRERLEFNDTLVASTALLEAEYEGLDIDLAATDSDDWGARVVGYVRAMRRTGE
jgi:hypothetical protein